MMKLFNLSVAVLLMATMIKQYSVGAYRAEVMSAVLGTLNFWAATKEWKS